jgi:hypothetical protein
VKLLAAFLIAAATGSPPSSSPGVETLPQPDGSVMLHINAESAAQCTAEGGCGVVTRQFIDEIQRRAFEAGKREAAAESDSACWRSRKES